MVVFRCPHCRERISRLKRYCPACGKKIRDSGEEESPRFIFSSPTMVAGGLALALVFLVILLLRFFT